MQLRSMGSADHSRYAHTTAICTLKARWFSMRALHIASWYSKFNWSQFGLPPSSHKMTRLDGKMVWTMTYTYRPHSHSGWRPTLCMQVSIHVQCSTLSSELEDKGVSVSSSFLYFSSTDWRWHAAMINLKLHSFFRTNLKNDSLKFEGHDCSWSWPLSWYIRTTVHDLQPPVLWEALVGCQSSTRALQYISAVLYNFLLLVSILSEVFGHKQSAPACCRSSSGAHLQAPPMFIPRLAQYM